jgi:hypothetical protein
MYKKFFFTNRIRYVIALINTDEDSYRSQTTSLHQRANGHGSETA